MLINFNLMFPRCCTQILPDSINGRIDKPFVECLHNELCCDIPADVVLESNVPRKVL